VETEDQATVEDETTKQRLAFGQDDEKTVSDLSQQSAVIAEEDEGEGVSRPSAAAETGEQTSSIQCLQAKASCPFRTFPSFTFTFSFSFPPRSGHSNRPK